MKGQIAKYRAEAADYRNREAQARQEGRLSDAASYASTAYGRELLADALEMEHDLPDDEEGTHCFCDEGECDCTYATGGSGYI